MDTENGLRDALRWDIRPISLSSLRRNIAEIVDSALAGVRYVLTRHDEPVGALVSYADLRCLDALRRINPDRLTLEMGRSYRQERIAISRVVGWMETQEIDEEIEAGWRQLLPDEDDDDE